MWAARIVFALGLALADAAYLTAVSHGTIVPARRVAVARRAASAEMVAAKEIFSKYLDGQPSMQKTLTKVPKSVNDAGAAAAIAATAAAGFALTPSSRIAVNVVGGALSSTIGVFGRKKILAERKKAAVPAVASLLSDGLQGVTPDSLSSIMKDYGVEKSDFQAQLGELYLAYLDACLSSSQVETAELSELLRLGDVLRLTPAQVGNKVYAAARNLYSRHRAYLEDDEDHDSKRILNKFVFLAERVLSADESEEGYRYETLRLQKLFGILAVEWKATAEKEAMPFYQKALGSAVLDGKPVTAAQLGAVRASLGISEGCAAGMHLEVLTTLATTLLKPEAGAEALLTDGDNERLSSASELLSVSSEAVEDIVGKLGTPLYEATFATIAAEAPADVDERYVADVAGTLTLRQQQLRLPAAKAHEIETAALRAVASELLAGATGLVRAQNVAAALAEVSKLVHYANSMTMLMVAMDHVEGEADEAFGKLFEALDLGEAKASEVLSLYRVFLLSCLEALKISESDSKALGQLRALTGISQAQSDSVYEASAGPLFRRVVEDAVAGDLDAAAKAKVATSLSDLALPASVTATLQLEVYKEKLTSKTEIKKLVDEDEAAALRALRDFLDLSFDAVEPTHAQVFESSYVDAVQAVFKQEAPIPDEYWSGLEALQARLGLSQSTVDGLFAKVAEAKMRDLGGVAIEALETKAKGDAAQARKEQGASTAEDEKGEFNIEVNAGEKMLDETLAIIEFAEATRVLQESGVACTLRAQYEDKTLKELYRQFLIEGFSGKAPEKNERIFANMEKLAAVIGLRPDEVALIHDNLGSIIYKQVCNKALQDGPIGPQERQTLESIKTTLDMDPAKCDALVADCQLFRVSTMVEQMFERSSVTADDSRKVRDTADLLDVDLLDDLQMIPSRLERMYMVELEDIIDAGELSPENTAELAEICEPLHIDEETAGRILEQTVSKRCAGGLLQAAALLRQNEQSAALEELQKLLKYAALAPGMGAVEAKSVSMRERNELALLFQASSLTGGELDMEAKEKLALLKEVSGIVDL